MHIGSLPRKISADGTYSTISEDLFNKMLSCLRENPASWNPVIKSKPDLGKEVIINRYGFDRYFRSATSPHIPNDKITCIKQDGRYYSMKLGQFDDMLQTRSKEEIAEILKISSHSLQSHISKFERLGLWSEFKNLFNTMVK